MNSTRVITDILWVLPLVIQAGVLFALLKRRLWATFPLFFAYTAAVLAREVILIFLPYASSLYGHVYWYGEVLTVSLGLAAIFETLRHLFPQYRLVRVILQVIWILGGIAASGAIVMLVVAQMAPASNRAYEIVILAERFARFVQACSLIVVIVLVLHLGSSWRQYSVGIAAGFGVYSALALLIFEFYGRLHLMSNSAFVMLNSSAYNLGTVIWGIYFLAPQRSPECEQLPTPNLSAWNDVVTEYYT
ncbi:MAG TPA: hypothetical protein VGU90_15190, partial [Terriglobales bacterium]|nr:hypothetical protein [Terriglobales bacterium]